MSKIIIYGTGPDAKECYNEFGSENVLFFVSDSYNQKNTIICGCETKSVIDLIKFMDENKKNDIDIVICIRKDNIYGHISMANKLEKLNLVYSIWHDIKKRWPDLKSFLKRDKTEFPYEREIIYKIRESQLKYLFKHIDAKALSHSTGKFRKYQLEALKKTKNLFSQIEDEKIKLFMAGGTLIGALRHSGYIPWDDDLDFAILSDSYFLLIDKLENNKNVQVFYHSGYRKIKNKMIGVYKTRHYTENLDNSAEYLCRIGFGYIRIYYNTYKEKLMDNQPICDIFPLYYFSNSYSNEEYYNDIRIFSERRKMALVSTDMSYVEEMMKKKIIVKRSTQVGYGHPHITSLLHWYPGSFQTWKMCDISKIIPFQEMKFENTTLWAPACPEDFLAMVGYEKWNSVPKAIPYGHHDSHLDWNSNIVEEICAEIIKHKE